MAAPNFGKAITGGIKNFGRTLKGSNIKDATKTYDSLNNKLLNTMNNKNIVDFNSHQINIDDLTQKTYDAFLDTMIEKQRTGKARLGVGAGVVGVGTLGAKTLRGKKEKTACDIVDETFEKVAKINMEGIKGFRDTFLGKNIGPARDAYEAAKAEFEALKGITPDNINPLTHGDNAMAHLSPKDRHRILNWRKRMFSSELRKTNAARKKVGLAVAGTGAAVGAGITAKKMYDKKKAEKMQNQ